MAGLEGENFYFVHSNHYVALMITSLARRFTVKTLCQL